MQLALSTARSAAWRYSFRSSIVDEMKTLGVVDFMGRVEEGVTVINSRTGPRSSQRLGRATLFRNFSIQCNALPVSGRRSKDGPREEMELGA